MSSRAWRPRADLPDSLVRFENAIIDIDVVLEVGIPLLNTILKVVFVPIKMNTRQLDELKMEPPRINSCMSTRAVMSGMVEP